MGKKSIVLVATFLALAIGIMAKKVDDEGRDAIYTFQVNGYKMVRSTHRSERTNEKAFILEKLLSDPKELTQFPLLQASGQTFLSTKGTRNEPQDQEDVTPRADLVHSKGQVKDFYKLKYNPASDEKPSTVVCLPRLKATELPEGNFRYKFTTKAESTMYGTITYSCYVTPDNDNIKTLFETLPGTVDEKTNIKTMGQ